MPQPDRSPTASCKLLGVEMPAVHAALAQGAEPMLVLQAIQAVTHARSRGQAANLLFQFVCQGLLAPDPAADILEQQAIARGDVPCPSSWRVSPIWLMALIGTGAFGKVYLGYDQAARRPMAVKFLHDRLNADESYVDRFLSEAKAAALLRHHPNIVQPFLFARDNFTDSLFLCTEYVGGLNVQELLRLYGPLPVGDAVRIALDVARALEYMRKRSFAHGDVKPSNILLHPSGSAKLTDLGLARPLNEANHLNSSMAKITGGTLPYMPPEQMRRAPSVDHRGDLFALGATFYHMVTQTLPFPAKDFAQSLRMKINAYFTLASAYNPTLPEELDRILCKLLAPDPCERYQTAVALVADLEQTRLASPVLTFLDSPEHATLGALGWPTLRV